MLDRDDLSQELEADLRDGGVYAVYQPLIEVATGDLVGVEGLCRWDRSGGVPVGPDVFIPVAESSGLIHALGRFMVDECLAAGDRWRLAGWNVEVSVNVSPVQLTTATFSSDLAAKMIDRVAPPVAFTIEITESLPLADLDDIVPRLEELRSINVGVSLDDFGSGHASAGQLRRLPLTEVKFDRSLIQSHSPSAMSALQQAVARARELGLRTVAEGIETSQHLERARELGCDRAQGFLFGAPMRIAEVDAILAG
ncbi:EAL domain-containing protein [Microbacterium pumilum]|uniref:EAL domain-containing protein n=1 Tax=Microbacterium pumilum TaxID=344165 RepID=A0ABN2S5C6_9MICO